jgi:hypothetical protein
MEWQVQGADDQTGATRSVLVTGRTRADAEWEARFLGIVPSSCVRFPAADPPLLPSGEPNMNDVPPPYIQLKADASRVRFWATVLVVLGTITALLGALLLVIGCAEPEPILLISGTVAILNGGCLLAGAALMSLLASLGEAIRDIARKV